MIEVVSLLQEPRPCAGKGGVPAIMYGCETMGLSDSCLSEVKCKVANAAAPNAGGKNHILALLALGSVGCWGHRCWLLVHP